MAYASSLRQPLSPLVYLGDRDSPYRGSSYITAQGVSGVASEQRHWVDPHGYCGNSYFRSG
ncbi:MAG: hypothetical protein WBA57_06640 [Elainellaceae cyanobacterium]